jgi:glycine/D-amino acid oxidase-like deaminating enzyme
MKSVVVIGSGIMGLAHAITAREANYAVTLLERNTRPLGASVRNFGTLWPIGLAFGPEREQAMFGLSRWSELSKKAGFWADHSMHLDALVMEALAAFVRIPDLRISSCWNGIYLKSTIGQTQVVLKPRERVTMVTAMGGLGMTLSWGMARKTIDTWKE